MMSANASLALPLTIMCAMVILVLPLRWMLMQWCVVVTMNDKDDNESAKEEVGSDRSMNWFEIQIKESNQQKSIDAGFELVASQ